MYLEHTGVRTVIYNKLIGYTSSDSVSLTSPMLTEPDEQRGEKPWWQNLSLSLLPLFRFFRSRPRQQKEYHVWMSRMSRMRLRTDPELHFALPFGDERFINFIVVSGWRPKMTSAGRFPVQVQNTSQGWREAVYEEVCA